MSLTLEQILAANDSGVKKVACPEWGGDVFIRSLTADDRDKIEDAKREGVCIRALMVGLSLCDENGKPLKPTTAQIRGLGLKSAKVMERVADAVLELNGLTAAAEEETEKNSSETDDAN